MVLIELILAAKRGGKQVFGVASEEGVISFVNGSEDNAWDFGEFLLSLSGRGY